MTNCYQKLNEIVLIGSAYFDRHMLAWKPIHGIDTIWKILYAIININKSNNHITVNMD